jgi:anti-sigma factor RsiW
MTLHKGRTNSEACAATQGAFSEYLDGAVSGHEMRAIADHLDACLDCSAEFSAWREMQQGLAAMRGTRAPADIALKLRVAISQQKAKQSSRWIDRLAVRWENALRPMLIQVSAGFAGTVVLAGSILLVFGMGMVAAPEGVLANDVPLGAMTAPHYLYSAAGTRAIATDHDTTIVVEAAINSSGRVYDYKIVSEPMPGDVQTQVAEQLMLSVFEPAKVFGEPVRGRLILTYSGVSVHG